MAVSRSDRVFVAPPDPGRAGTLDELIAGLRLLKAWAGDPSYDTIKDRINVAWRTDGRPRAEWARRATVADCFKTGRKRLNADLVVAVVAALQPDVGYVAQWRQALRFIAGETRAASQVRVQDKLPPDLAGFTGRTAELDRLTAGLRHGSVAAGAVVITGMAGVGKTQLAIHAGHLLAQDHPFDHVMFVNLRGFHPDPSQPPADPAAVLDGFLRLLGVPGPQIPHDLPARAVAYRNRLAGSHTLIVLDNAAGADQVRPLLPDTPGCPVLVTSRHSLTSLRPAAQLTVDVFTFDEALEFLAQAALRVPTGADPDAAARIADRCGHLPLALGLVAAHIRNTPGWTLTDHADRLDEHHQHRHLDTGVQLALDLSYQHLPKDRQRLLRMAALHPGQDLDTHAAAALSGSDLETAEVGLHQLAQDHLVQEAAPGRYAQHDLVRAYAAGRASDEDPPPERRAALTRLFDHCLATAAAAMDTLHPGETHLRPCIPTPTSQTLDLTDPGAARAWLDTERPTLIAVAAYAAAHGWPTHTTRLAATLYRYLAGGYHTDALAVHGHAYHAAQQSDEVGGQAHALTNLGIAHLWLGRYRLATDHLNQALALYQQATDPVGQARTLGYLGAAQERLGHYLRATEHLHQALHLFRQAGDRTGQARVLGYLGDVEGKLGRYQPATDHLHRALTLYRQAGDRHGEATALNSLGDIEGKLGQYRPATDHLHQALALCREFGDRTGEAGALDRLGTLHARLDRSALATEYHQQALAILRETGQRDGEAWALNGLGEAARIAGHTAHALTHHTAALAIAVDIGTCDQQARAHAGLGHAHYILGNLACARHHYQHARALYTDLGMPDADQIRAYLSTIDETSPPERGRTRATRTRRSNS